MSLCCTVSEIFYA